MSTAEPTALRLLRAEVNRRQPSEKLCMALGRHLMPGITTACSYEQIAEAFGLSRQRAYQLSTIALGKFAFHFFKRFGMPGSLAL